MSSTARPFRARAHVCLLPRDKCLERGVHAGVSLVTSVGGREPGAMSASRRGRPRMAAGRLAVCTRSPVSMAVARETLTWSRSGTPSDLYAAGLRVGDRQRFEQACPRPHGPFALPRSRSRCFEPAELGHTCAFCLETNVSKGAFSEPGDIG